MHNPGCSRNNSPRCTLASSVGAFALYDGHEGIEMKAFAIAAVAAIALAPFSLVATTSGVTQADPCAGRLQSTLQRPPRGARLWPRNLVFQPTSLCRSPHRRPRWRCRRHRSFRHVRRPRARLRQRTLTGESHPNLGGPWRCAAGYLWRGPSSMSVCKAGHYEAGQGN